MTKVRKSDIVTLRAIVTNVAPYDGKDQICVRLLPKGKELGWLIANETDYEVAEVKLVVGDQVKVIDRPGHVDSWEIKAIFDNDQVAIQKVGNWPVELVRGSNLRRL